MTPPAVISELIDSVWLNDRSGQASYVSRVYWSRHMCVNGGWAVVLTTPNGSANAMALGFLLESKGHAYKRMQPWVTPAFIRLSGRLEAENRRVPSLSSSVGAV